MEVILLKRLNQLVEKMQKNDISNMVISDPYSIKYLINYYTQAGERLLALIVRADGQHLLVLNQLFPMAQESDSYQIITYRDGENIIKIMADHLLDGNTSIDKYWPSSFLIDLMEQAQDLQAVNASYLIDDLRAVKEAEEIEQMRQASHLNDQAMDQIIQALEDQITEEEAADKLDTIYKELGHHGPSFDLIIAYGANAADPHHTRSHSLPQVGDSIVIDIGGAYQDYVSDMTRTVFYGEASEEALHIYNLVLEANLAAIAAVKPGVPFSDIDAAGRKVIEDAGYGSYFTHRIGHFIGQEVHEAGDVSEFNHSLTKVGQIFSIEPGIYLPGKLGVRIEDLVLVTEDGVEVLNHYPKEAIIIAAK